MQVRELKPINFLFFQTTTTVQELSNYLSVAEELYQEAARLHLRITGPVHWHYEGFTDHLSPFKLSIAIPIAEVPQSYDGPFHIKRTDVFKCVTTTHNGSWLDIPSAYARLLEYVSMNQLVPKGTNRELYINVDFINPEANYTEIQLGIV